MSRVEVANKQSSKNYLGNSAKRVYVYLKYRWHMLVFVIYCTSLIGFPVHESSTLFLLFFFSWLHYSFCAVIIYKQQNVAPKPCASPLYDRAKG